MMNRLTGAALAVLFILGLAAPVPTVQAQNLQVGFTDHELLILNMEEYRQIQQQLQTEAQNMQQGLQTSMADYQEKLDRYQKQQALLSPERRQEREQELMQLQGEIQQSAAQAEQQLANREAELMRPLMEQVQTAITEVAEAEGLDIVLRGQGILYINPDRIVDITMAVATKLGIEVDEDETAAANPSN